LVAVRFVDPPKSDLLAAEEFKFTIGDTAFDAADRLPSSTSRNDLANSEKSGRYTVRYLVDI